MLLACYAGLLGVVGFDRFDIVYPMAAPVLAGLNSWVTATAAVAVINQREKLRIQKQFRARVSPQLVDLLAENPKALSMGGVERETTILFGDLAGFTTISEQLGGPDVVKTLNLYMGAMTRELTAQNAYVNKFLGDGLLAFWSAFVPEPRQCQLAIASAIACQRLVKEIGQRPDRAGLPPITLRLGIATGKVVIGDCGAPPDLNDYTVIGDSVNLAARLESANKQFGTSILVDGTTAVAARESGLPLCSLGRVVVVGQSVPIDLHEVCVDADPQERIRMTEQAVQAFARGDFAASREAFGALETRFGKSKTAVAFREAMDDPNDRRDGVLRLRAK
jgi:adenylate cyclase